jgi:hypothetical protein
LAAGFSRLSWQQVQGLFLGRRLLAGFLAGAFFAGFFAAGFLVAFLAVAIVMSP